MELRHLRHFLAIVDAGSLSRATEQLGLTQSALTRSVKTLEASIDATLLDRSASGVVPTRAGKAMYEYAKFMVHEAARIRSEVKRAAANLAGTISLGADPAFAEKHLHRALSVLGENYESLSVQVQEGDIDDTVPLLIAGQIELIVSTVPIMPIRADLIYERLGFAAWRFFVGEGHPCAGRKEIAGHDLLRRRWALLDRPHELDLLASHFAARSSGMPTDVVRTGSMALIRSLVIEGGMIGFLPEHYMANTPAVALDAFSPPVVRPIGMLTRAGGHASQTLIDLTGILRREYRERAF